MDVTQPVNAPLPPAAEATSGRPTHALPWAHLLNLSVYWLGINAIWAGLGYVIYQSRFTARYGETFAPSYVALLETVPLLIAVFVQPTVAAISDYTVTRWGRRKPYIFVGAIFDVIFLWGIASVERVRGDPRVRDPAPGVVQLRAGSVPGLRTGSRAAEAGWRRPAA